jgi:hypothetical protein
MARVIRHPDLLSEIGIPFSPSEEMALSREFVSPTFGRNAREASAGSTGALFQRNTRTP